jgi:hypothetical protein
VGKFETDVARIVRHLEVIKPEGVALQRSLVQIGRLLEAKVKENIGKKGLSDSGELRDSIKYSVRMFANGGEVVVGSYGIKYAKIHEYGGVIRPVFVRKLAIPVSSRAKADTKAGQGPGSYGRTENHPDSTYWNPQYYRVKGVLKDVDTNETAWILASKLEITEKRYMRDSLDELTPHILRIIGQFGMEAQ